jgi:hypothetical protein
MHPWYEIVKWQEGGHQQGSTPGYAHVSGRATADGRQIPQPIHFSTIADKLPQYANLLAFLLFHGAMS